MGIRTFGDVFGTKKYIQRVKRPHIQFSRRHAIVCGRVLKFRLGPLHAIQEFTQDLLAGFGPLGTSVFHTKVGNPLYAGPTKKTSGSSATPWIVKTATTF
jgi:hypothetical protein